MSTEVWKKFELVHNFIWGATSPLKSWFVKTYKDDENWKPPELTDWNAAMELVETCKVILELLFDNRATEQWTALVNELQYHLSQVNRDGTYDACVKIIQAYMKETGKKHWESIYESA